MEIRFVDRIGSTHQWLCEAVKNGDVAESFALLAGHQTNGVGSRGNEWKSGDGNLYLSYAIKSDDLPQDLPHASTSIYFSYILLQIMRSYGSRAWLKWPNDFYLDDKKIGGTITAKIKNFFVVSHGLNLCQAKGDYGVLDVSVNARDLTKELLESFKIFPSWKQIFSNYRLEFQLSQKFCVHIEGELFSLQRAVLCPDGSIEIDNKKVYSLR